MPTLSDSKTVSKEFFNLKISQRNLEYDKSYFDEVNSKLIFEQLQETDDDRDDLTLVTPEDPTVLLTVTVESLLALLKYDVVSGSAITLKDITAGDSVGLIQNRVMYPGVYLGTEFFNNTTYYCVKRADLSSGMVEKIPQGREWRIQPYSATETVKQKRSTKVYGKELEEILGLPAGGLKAFQKSKVLVVAPDKSRLIDAIRDVAIGGDPLETIFPIADYTSEEDWRYVGSYGINNIKQEPIIGLVANCDIAVDIALKDPNYKLLIVDGAAKIRSNYGSIELFNADENPRKTLCLLRPTDEEEIKTLKAMGIDSYIWKRQDFNEIELPTLDTNEEMTPFSQHKQIINNLAGNEPEYREVSLPADIERTIDESYQLLYSLSRKIASTLPESGLILRWGISLLNSWLQLPVTLKEFHSSKIHIEQEKSQKLDDKFNNFKLRMQEAYGLYIPSINKLECEELLTKMDIIYAYFSNDNPKAAALQELLDSKDIDTNIYCCQSAYTSAFNETNDKPNVRAKNIEQLSIVPVDRAIVTGWSSRRNSAHGFLAPAKDIIFLLYKKELESIRYVYKTHPSSPSSNFDQDFRRRAGFEINETTNEPDSNPDNSIETILDYVSRKFTNPLFPAYDSRNVQVGSESVEAKQILFEDGSIVYANSDYNFDLINRSARKMLRVNTLDINLGDELVFADTERSMFEELLSILQKSDEYQNLTKTSNLWRDALQTYVESDDVDDYKLVTMFQMVGCPKSIHTIRSWLDGKVIGPSGENYAAIDAICKITNDATLLRERDEVIRACKTLHALHVKTGWLLVRNIINSAIEQEDDDINEETRARLSAYAGSTKLKVVKEISEQTFSVPSSELGKLHEAFS